MTGVYSVTQINTYIKNMFAQDFVLNTVRVQGEVSNCKYHTSGHIYFTLKDAGGTLSAVMFAGRRKGLNFRLDDGVQIVVEGSIEVYVKGGSFQIYADRITRAGVGELYERFVRLKEKLGDMGMFAPEYKQAIPKYASRIGVVTAPTGAAIQDIINITRRRNPYVQLILCPARVQGEGAAKSVASAIRKLDKAGVEVMIVGRGGGSLEDLWAFNEEEVARAIFEAGTPVISAVGHETDYTIADYTADMRAPTPSAAAELAVYDYAAFEAELERKRTLLKKAVDYRLKSVCLRSVAAGGRLERRSPENRLKDIKAMKGSEVLRLDSAMKERIRDLRTRLGMAAERLRGLSPLEKLASGYAWISDQDDVHIRKMADMKEGELINITFSDGTAVAEVREIPGLFTGR